MAKTFKDKKMEAKAISMQATQPKQIESADLYIFSSSTHVGNAPFKTRRFLKRLRKQGGTKYALVTTNIEPQKAKTLKTMEEILESKGFKEVADPLVLRVEGLKGPLEGKFQDKVLAYIEKINKL
jgi:hypothetical protein